MFNEDGTKIEDIDLLKGGLQHLDDALALIMEMECAGGSALAHFLHAALTFGEKLVEAVDAQ
jgi:hypothetical protein